MEEFGADGDGEFGAGGGGGRVVCESDDGCGVEGGLEGYREGGDGEAGGYGRGGEVGGRQGRGGNFGMGRDGGGDCGRDCGGLKMCRSFVFFVEEWLVRVVYLVSVS